jgi:hypothetical protein
MNLINECISKAKSMVWETKLLEKALNRYRLKQEFMMERSVELCKRLTTYELMFEDSRRVYSELEDKSVLEATNVNGLINKVLKNPAIQVVE